MEMELPQFETKMFLLLFVFINLCFGQFKEGDTCYESYTRQNGTCISLTNCLYAIELIEDHVRPVFCNTDFKENFNALACCIDQKHPLRRSIRMCRRYHKPGAFGIYVIGGRKSLAEEFPHMAAIGYGEKDEIEWLCGGSLISEKYVLTAAHCILTLYGNPKWVRLGDLDLAVTTDDAEPQDFAIVRTVTHPKYQPPSLYHDIGLLELDKQPKVTKYVDIACLYPYDYVPETYLIASGWGKTDFAGQLSSHLLAVDLNITENTKCNVFYHDIPKNTLANGIIDQYQLCAGSNGKDTCQGDSGGPLQRLKPNYPLAKKLYDIMGITSFGRGCGLGDSPGIYTRVSAYLDWIENIVWPNLEK